jgi:thiol-disulfide isomerase/thioredoxin
MSKALAALVTLILSSPPAGTPDTGSITSRAHQRVRDGMSAHGGRALFSDLYNLPELPGEERDYLARLYEVFFALPAHLDAEHTATGRVPSRQALADNFGIGLDAVDLLLHVMTTDPRMPKVLSLTAQGEIAGVEWDALRSFVAQRGASVTVSGWAGKPLPAFEVESFAGARVRDTDLRGRPAIVFLWLTRCPVCQRITPHMVELHRKYADRGVRILALNADAALGLAVSDEERRKFVAERGIRYEAALLDAKTRAAFGNLNIFPALFLVKADGTIVRLVINYQDLAALDAQVAELLAGA